MSRSETKRTARPVFGGPQVVGICVFTVALFAWVHFLPAQAMLSTIRGSVTDPSGALVPGADIVLTDLTTNAARTVVSPQQIKGTWSISNPAARRADAVQVWGFHSCNRFPGYDSLWFSHRSAGKST
jgi:hypothetical protein